MNENKQKKICWYVVLAASVPAIIYFSGCLLFNGYDGRRFNHHGQAFYASAAQEFAPYNNTVVYEPTPPPLAVIPAIDIDTEAEINDVPFKPTMDFTGMRASFPRVVGWIQSEGTPIDYPVVHCFDNAFYLSHLPDDTPHYFGSVFMDFRHNGDFSESNILLYGHNIRSGDKFGSLLEYVNQDYYEAHDRMRIFTPTADYVLVIFAGYVLDSSVEVPPTYFTDEEMFGSYIHSIRARSVFDSDIVPVYGDRLVFLCTCTNGPRTERLIIVGKLEEI